MRKEIGCLSKKSMIACLASIALAMVLTSRTAVGQYSTASLAGTVTDPSGASIPGAKVTVQNNDTGFTQTFTTEAEGEFLFPRLLIGNYTLTVERPGFATYVREAIGLTVGQAATIDIKMRLGEVTEKVTVQADGFEPVSIAADSNAQLHRKIISDRTAFFESASSMTSTNLARLTVWLLPML